MLGSVFTSEYLPNPSTEILVYLSPSGDSSPKDSSNNIPCFQYVLASTLSSGEVEMIPAASKVQHLVITSGTVAKSDLYPNFAFITLVETSLALEQTVSKSELVTPYTKFCIF